MRFHSFLASWKSEVSRSRRAQPRPARPRTRLVLDQLEDRSLPSSYSAASVSDLIADINAANAAGGNNTITLTTGSEYALMTADNSTSQYGANGLPVIATNDNLTIVGNGAYIDNEYNPSFRYFFVSSGASLTLQDLKLYDGLAAGSGGAAEGGAIYSAGSLTLNGVGAGVNKANSGGAVYIAAGTANISNSTFEDNLAGSNYGNAAPSGGAVYIAAGTANISNSTFEDNYAEYTDAFWGSSYYGSPAPNVTAYGGAVYVAAGTAHFSSDIMENNTARGSGKDSSYGGGLAIAKGANVYNDALTLANTIDNNAAHDPDIYGHYTKT